jgi:hypothetical protein
MNKSINVYQQQVDKQWLLRSVGARVYLRALLSVNRHLCLKKSTWSECLRSSPLLLWPNPLYKVCDSVMVCYWHLNDHLFFNLLLCCPAIFSCVRGKGKDERVNQILMICDNEYGIDFSVCPSISPSHTLCEHTTTNWTHIYKHTHASTYAHTPHTSKQTQAKETPERVLT